MSNTAIRAVLFDFGGVLAEEGFRSGLYTIASENGLDPKAFHRAAQDAVYDSGYVTGRGSESDFWGRLRERFDLGSSDAELTDHILKCFMLRPTMLAAVRRLRRHGLICGILSDQTDWLERLNARDHFYREFDQVYNSYRMGKGKRDASLFDDVVRELGLQPRQVMFVDDSVGNVTRARARGLRGIRCDNARDCLEQLAHRLGAPVVEG